MKRTLLLLPLLAAAVGCSLEPSSSTPKQVDAREIMRNDRPKRQLRVVRLRMVTIEVPIGTVSGSEEVWSYLNEEQIAAIHPIGLSRNGFRVGIGARSSWPDLAAVLTRLTGRALQESAVLALPGNPVQFELKRNQPFQTIFMFAEDGTLRGEDYPPGDNLLTLTATLDANDPNNLIVTALPQLRAGAEHPTIVTGPGGPKIVHRQALYSFTDMAFQMRLPAGDFIVVGPGSVARRKSSVGHHFLIHDRKGIPFETVLVIIPKAVMAETRAYRPQ